MSKYILAIDQGTTSSRAIIYDLQFQIISSVQLEFNQYFPNEGWVEHDAFEIWESQLTCCRQVIDKASISVMDIASIGITNQRETVIAWQKSTGNPIYNAIVWQDRRTAIECVEDEKSIGAVNKSKTGLPIDPYFSASKMRWILQNVETAPKLIENNDLCIGTIDTWLIWKLTKGALFATDYSNASRTNLFNIKDLTWDKELLDYYQIPLQILPEVKDTMGHFGSVDAELFGTQIPIMAVAGDQQASLYGHQCTQSGMVKSTMGTGCFLLKNIGEKFIQAENGLLTTIAWVEYGKPTYAIEGSIFHAGSILKWLKENLGLIQNYGEIDRLVTSIDHCEDVIVVPAFTGLGAPHWDLFARGMISGLTRNTSKAHIVRASIESIAYQTRDIVAAMDIGEDSNVLELCVDGGVSSSDFLMQFLSDILQVKINRTISNECTALGVALMAAKAQGMDLNALKSNLIEEYFPQMSIDQANLYYARWQKAVEKLKESIN